MKRPVVFAILVTSSTLLVDCKDDNTAGREGQPITMNCETPFPLRTGYATYYTWANGGGNCMFDPTPHDLMVGAMNAMDYAGSAACGSCVKITGPRGQVVVRIVDQCGDCPQGNIDLSPQAFERIAELAQGRVPITWQYVPCEVQGNIIYHFKDGSNQWWTAVQVRNHRYPIVRLEYLMSSGTFRTVSRMEYNYFVEPNGMGPGPYTFRVTDVYGRVLVDSGIPHVENGDVPGAGQFPPCRTSGGE
ncbi:MAG TPA: expansin EXLX1 family cellulose-binding protein [Bacteroidota bacterium]|nr:expansin EXLX1 family cellulose-binding protein [Bacteroidota bacterium]